MNKYFNWRSLEGYNAPLLCVLGRRGIGKTFSPFKSIIRRCLENKNQFTYVVENKEMVKELSRNNGEKFFLALITYLENESKTSKRASKFLEKLQGGATVGYDELDIKTGIKSYKIEGGTIKINKETLGYILSWNDFANLKRNNFDKTKYVFIDEIISEKMDKTTLDISRKVISLVQSIARNRDIKIYMCGNTIRLNDPMLQRLKIWDLKEGETRVVKDSYGVLMVAHLIDNSLYPEFIAEADASVSGRLASYLNEDNLDKGIYKDSIKEDMLIPFPRLPSKFMACFHGEMGSIRIEITKGTSELYIMNDYGTNKTNRYCLDKRFITTNVFYNPDWYDSLSSYFSRGMCKFDTSVTYLIFKDILKAI